jgi:hypothetical protein
MFEQGILNLPRGPHETHREWIDRLEEENRKRIEALLGEPAGQRST